MQHSLALLLFLALSLVAALALPQEVINGHYPGRSGDVLLRHKATVSAGKAYMTLLAKNVQLKQPTLAETEVADLIAHLMGVAPLNPHTNRANFPRVNFFDTPRANVLFFVASSHASGQVALTSEAYPSDSIAMLTSLLTGSNPSRHGIVQRSWYDQASGEVVAAYSSPEAGARAHSFQDLVTVAFGGDSLVVSAAACRMFASALAAKTSVLPEDNNNHALHWNADSQSFASVYSTAQEDSLALGLAEVEAFVASLGTYDSAKRLLSVGGSTFDLNHKADVGFFAELAFVHSLVDRLKTDEGLKALVADKASDFFTFAFSLRGLEREYGADSAEVKTAHSILNKAISFVSQEIETLYHGRSISEIISFASPPRPSKELINEAKSAVDADSVFFVYPQVYLTNWLSDGEAQSASVCQKLSISLSDFEVYCAGSIVSSSMPQIQMEVMRVAILGNSTDEPTSEEIATFQIVLWTSVILILTTLFASLLMASVYDTSYSVIYNSPALQPKSS